MCDKTWYKNKWSDGHRFVVSSQDLAPGSTCMLLTKRKQLNLKWYLISSGLKRDCKIVCYDILPYQVTMSRDVWNCVSQLWSTISCNIYSFVYTIKGSAKRQRNMIWCNVIWYDAAQFNLIDHEIAWYHMISMVWSNSIPYVLIWYM